MKILLTHGYFLEEDAKEKSIMRPYPTLGLLYVSGYLKNKGVEHDVFDTTFSSTDLLRKHIKNTRPNVIAFYTNLMTKVKVIEFIRFIRNNENLKETKIVLGGPDITYNKNNYLKTGADYLIIGEGEETFCELVTALKSNSSVGEIGGLAYIEEGELTVNAPRVKMKELENLPLPNRSAYPIHKYLETWKTYHGESALNISTQRGCPYTCKWCSTAVYGQSYRRRSAISVVEELQLLIKEYNPDTFWFVDDVFTVSHKWLEEFHQEILASGIKIKYECITRAERMNDKVIQWLKETGCFRVWIGAESGSQKVIDAMDRRVKVSQVKDMLIRTKAAGISTGTFIMVGYPGETLQDIHTTARYLESSLPDYFTITKSYPIKGTRLYDDIESEITKQPDWFTSTDREIDFKRPYSDRFYDLAVRYIHNRVQVKRNELTGQPNWKAKTKVMVSKLGLQLLAI
ncbi:MAG: B12-binding domain-containing radical SAM protein [Crocinitomicaceae bacterium]|nr:B12-binding domain-containing radical SAM protein [Crocinitomicaceae bacterium]|tara:strand:- start:18408 stop:19781 length:1374 start_codon:yes stop_codon:yes gene_type:complete